MSFESLERRQFLAAVAAATALAGCERRRDEPAAAPAASGPPTATDPWSRLRAQFELADGWVHMAGFLLASHPRPVREAIARHRQALDANPAAYVEANFGAEAAALAPAAAYMEVRPDEIALTDVHQSLFLPRRHAPGAERIGNSDREW